MVLCSFQSSQLPGPNQSTLGCGCGLRRLSILFESTDQSRQWQRQHHRRDGRVVLGLLPFGATGIVVDVADPAVPILLLRSKVERAKGDRRLRGVGKQTDGRSGVVDVGTVLSLVLGKSN